MHVIDVMAMVMDIVKGLRCTARDRRGGDGEGHCYRVEVVMHVINVMAIVIDFVIELKI